VRAGTTSANILELEKGEVPIAYASQMIFAKMYGIEALKTTRIREVWAMYPQVWYLIVPKASPAKTIHDLRGKRIACGIRTGEGALFLDYIEALGLSEKDFKLQFIGKGEGIEALKGGAVDAFSAGSLVPSPDFTELAASRSGARIIEFGDADLGKILLKVRPLQSTGVIPAGSHPQIQKDIKTIVYGNSVCARDDVSQELVYGIVKTLHKRYKDLVEIFPGAKYSTAGDTAKYHVFPLHLGTQKFLKEIKVEFSP
jgi:TRAP transporter TAXI family solute receptor